MFGRLHPLIVHLPIGLFAAWLALELYRLKRDAEPMPAANRMLGRLTLLSALLSLATGWWLGSNGPHDGELLERHRWFGVAFASACGIAVFGLERSQRHCRFFGLGAAAMLLLVTGHLGGSLTHGPDFLWGASEETEALPPRASTPMARILDRHCIRCHGPGKKKGGLRLDTAEGLASVVEAGDATASELFRRIVLPADHEDVMPPDDRLEPGDVETVLAWIHAGASFESLSDEREGEAENDSGKAAEESASSSPDENLQRETVDFSIAEKSPGLQEIVGLAASRDSLKELSFAGKTLASEDWAAIPELSALQRLHLERSNVSDEDLALVLARTPNLRYLNLHSTRVSAASFDAVRKLEKLEKLFLFGTDVTEQELPALREDLPGCLVVGAVELPEFVPPGKAAEKP